MLRIRDCKKSLARDYVAFWGGLARCASVHQRALRRWVAVSGTLSLLGDMFIFRFASVVCLDEWRPALRLVVIRCSPLMLAQGLPGSLPFKLPFLALQTLLPFYVDLRVDLVSGW